MRRPPSARDLLTAPELASIVLLDCALDVARAALLSQHVTLSDHMRPPTNDGVVVELAALVCRRSASLHVALARYVRAVHHAARRAADDSDDDLPF